MEHAEEATVHFPVVALEGFERLSNGGKQQVSGQPVVAGEELVESFGNREDDMEMGAIRQALADLFRPLRLARPEAGGAMAVAAGAGIPFGAVAVPAFRAVKSQLAVAAVRHEVECRIAAFCQSARPEMPPLAENVVNGCVHAVHINTIRPTGSSTISAGSHQSHHPEILLLSSDNLVQQYLFVGPRDRISSECLF